MVLYLCCTNSVHISVPLSHGHECAEEQAISRVTVVNWSGFRRIGMALLLVLVVVSVLVVRNSTLPVPIAAGEISQDQLEPGDLLFVDIYNGWSQGGYWDHAAVY